MGNDIQADRISVVEKVVRKDFLCQVRLLLPNRFIFRLLMVVTASQHLATVNHPLCGCSGFIKRNAILLKTLDFFQGHAMFK